VKIQFCNVAKFQNIARNFSGRWSLVTGGWLLAPGLLFLVSDGWALALMVKVQGIGQSAQSMAR